MLSQLSIAIKIGAALWVAGILFSNLLPARDRLWVRTKLMPISIGLFVSGLLVPNLYIYWALIFGVTPFLARTRHEAACLYATTVLSAPLVAKEIGAAGVYILLFDKWLFASLGLLFASFIRPAEGPRPRGYFDWPFICIVLLDFAGLRESNFTSGLRLILSAILGLIVPYFVFSRSFRRPEHVRRFFVTLTFCACVLSVVAVYEARVSFLPYEAIQGHLGSTIFISPYTKQRGGVLRASTSFEESTSFGVFLALALVTALSIRTSFRAKRFWGVSIGLIGLGIYASNARGPLLAAGLGLLAYDVYRSRIGSMVAKMGAIGMLYLIIMAAAQFSTKIAERFGFAGGSVDTRDYRQRLVERGMEEIAKHPLFGITGTQIQIAMADMRQGEGIIDFVNTYVYVGLVAGVPGLLIFVLGFVLMASNAWRNRIKWKEYPTVLAMNGVVFSSAIFMMVIAYTSGFSGRSRMLFFMMTGIGSAMAAMRKPPLQSEEEAPAAAPVFAKLPAYTGHR